MANYSANLVKHATTAANTVDVVTLARDVNSVEIMNRDSASYLYVRVDGVDPAVLGDNSYPVPPSSTITLNTPNTTTQVRVISAAAVAYTVSGAS